MGKTYGFKQLNKTESFNDYVKELNLSERIKEPLEEDRANLLKAHLNMK